MLIRKVRFIQYKLMFRRTPGSLENIAKKFNDFMIAKNVNVALRLLSEQSLLGYFQQIIKSLTFSKRFFPPMQWNLKICLCMDKKRFFRNILMKRLTIP